MWYKIILIMTMLPLLINNAQEMRKMELQRMNRIEQLERIKLIENLNLSEEQSIRFFSRRNDHKKEIESIEKKVDELLSELNKILNSGEIKEAQLKKINEEILTNREKIATKRKQFIQSLTDILTTEQISKLLLFEIRFRDEIKNLIMKRRNHPR